MADITKVWIEDGECISCEACIDAAPDILEMDGDTCKVKDAAKDPAFCTANSDQIEAAVESCPVGAIKCE